MNVSRKDLYLYVVDMLYDITKNVYPKEIPTTLSSDAVSNGFIVIRMLQMKDFSEFDLDTYVQVRVSVECYVPNINTTDTQGRLSTKKFDDMQKAVDAKIKAECEKVNQTYSISRDGILSEDDTYTNKACSFSVYITSFLVTITNEV